MTQSSQLTAPIILKMGRHSYVVPSFRAASELFEAARDRYGEGSSKTPTPLLVDEAGKTVGYISYNGRVWPGTPQAWTPGIAPLYDNSEEA